MIKFACPGCQTSFNVSDDKAGKTGKCPKCQSQFVIPQADAGAAPKPPAPPTKTKTVDADAPVEIEPCPGCGAILTVAPEFLGADVECPSCQTVFAAAKPGAAKPKPKSKAQVNLPKQEDAFSGLGDDDEDEAPKKKKKSKRVQEDDEEPEEELPKKKKKTALAKVEADDDFDDEDRPKKKKGKEESKKIVAGLLALFLGGFGVHKFYLGYTMPGVIMLLTCGGCGIVNLIEGIMYLVAKDEDFLRNQQAGKKAWF